jgi:hypothetical protein
MAEVNQLAGAIRGEQGTEPYTYQSERYLALAAQKPLSLTSMVECSLRGIDPDSIETRNVTLRGSRTLGSGTANTVFLCEYDDGDAGRVNLVFKPEHEGRFGLRGIMLGALGYAPATRVVDLNTASCFVAGQIGCGNVLARTTAGCFDGRFGLFMEQAQGHSPRSWGESKNQEWQMLVRDLKANNTLDRARANLQKELCKLEWADYLSGQGDRHADNYFVHINPETGEVKVTGIDNDASFSHALGGRGIGFTVTDGHSSQTVTTNFAEILEDENPGDLLQALQQNTGLQHINLLSFIDRDTYTRLTGMTEQDIENYRQSLTAYLRGDETAVNTAMHRLADASLIADALADAGRVVDDWRTHTVRVGLHGEQEMGMDQYYTTMGAQAEEKSGNYAYLVQSFYTRDWLNTLQ